MVVVVVVVVDDGSKSSKLMEIPFCCSKSFSIEIGVVDGVGQPVNSVVALKIN